MDIALWYSFFEYSYNYFTVYFNQLLILAVGISIVDHTMAVIFMICIDFKEKSNNNREDKAGSISSNILEMNGSDNECENSRANGSTSQLIIMSSAH